MFIPQMLTLEVVTLAVLKHVVDDDYGKDNSPKMDVVKNCTKPKRLWSMRRYNKIRLSYI